MTHQTYRNDHTPGFCYLIEAIGFHGWLPGCYLRRMKIGLTRNIDRRLAGLSLNQPPCDYKVVFLIEVEDMTEVEKTLQKRFEHCQVELERSREWFDLNPIDYARCLWLFRQLSNVPTWKYIDFRQVAAVAVMLAGIATLTAPLIQNQLQPQVEFSPQPTTPTRIINRSQLKKINR